MQFSTLLVASAALAVASAKVALTNVGYSLIEAGKPFVFTWTPATGTIDLVLRGAMPGAAVTDPNNLSNISTIVANQTGGTYTWNVPATIPQATYAIQIVNSTNPADNNYSSLFEVIGGVRSNSTVTVSQSSTSTESATTETGSSTSTASTTGSQTATTSSTAAATSVPAGGMASGVTSNLGLAFLAAGALFMLN